MEFSSAAIDCVSEYGELIGGCTVLDLNLNIGESLKRNLICDVIKDALTRGGVTAVRNATVDECLADRRGVFVGKRSGNILWNVDNV